MRLLPIIKVILIATGIYLTNHSVAARLDYFLDFRLYFPILVFAGIWAASLIAIFYIAFTPRTTERVIWTLVICLAVMFGETYYLVVHDRLTISALDAMWAPNLVSMDIAAFYGKYVLVAFARVSPLLAGLLVPWRGAEPWLRWRAMVAIPLVPYFLLCGLIFYVGGAEGRETSGMPSQFLVPGLLSVFAASGPVELEKQPVDIVQDHPAQVKHIMLVVDESVSGDFIDLNVPRGVTPYLLSQEDTVINFGLALSGSNCSNASNALLRLGANPDQLGIFETGVLANPSIWAYAKKAGFETNFVEAQHVSESHLNFMNQMELDLIDHIETYNRDSKYSQRDQRMSGQIAAILSRPSPQFVYVNKYGTHFPYHRSYPEGQTVFGPSMKAYETIDSRERLVNSYKNAILWSVDHFFEVLLPQLDLSDSVLIYTSDHGQNLLDDGNPTTHCRRTKVSTFEAVVPLLVWTGKDSLHQDFVRAAEQNHGRASHFEIFPTIVELFGYDPEAIAQRYRHGLLQKIEDPLGFTSGPIIGRFNRKVDWHAREKLEELAR